MLDSLKVLLEKIKLLSYNEYTMENYFIKKGYSVGKGNRIYVKDLGTEPFLVKIGNHCTITGGVQFITHDGGCWVFRTDTPDLNKFGKIEVKDNCFIGYRSIILPNVTIGPNSVVGAGSVVTKDVPPNTVVAGVPARILCSLEDYKNKCYEAWAAVDLKGPRKMWEKQLVNYFWQNNKEK